MVPSSPNDPPQGYKTPPFPSLSIPILADRTPQRIYTIYYIEDAWRFTLFWTLITYAVFHLTVALVAVSTHGWKPSSWKFLPAVPIVYLVIAGFEAVVTGSVVGLILGAVYRAGHYEMNTWIPFTWGLSNVLILVISSFSIQGGL